MFDPVRTAYMQPFATVSNSTVSVRSQTDYEIKVGEKFEKKLTEFVDQFVIASSTLGASIWLLKAWPSRAGSSCGHPRCH